MLFTYNYLNHIIDLGLAHKIFVTENYMSYIEGSHIVVIAYSLENLGDEVLYAGDETQCNVYLISFYQTLKARGFTIFGLTTGVA